jgi:hypothetical protein
MVRLDRLVNVLGGYGARFYASPAVRGIELRSVVLHDETDSRVLAGDVFIAVGVESVARAVELAASARAAVVLVRASVPLGPDAVSDAEEHGVAVLAFDPAVSWSQVAGVVYGLVLEGRETESGRGPTDLFALADSLANAIGGAVVIEDQMSRVLAYSDVRHGADQVRLETILGRRLPDTVRALFERRGVFAHLATSDEPLFVEGDRRMGLTGRMVVGVRAGKELLGSVWMECAEPLTGDRYTALVDGSRTVALHLLRSRASADLERQIESELVIRLLEGTADAEAVVSQLGLPRSQFRVVAVRAHVLDELHAALLVTFERATTGFGWSRPGRSALFGNTLYTILPGDLNAARTWIDQLQTSLPAEAVLSAGIGGMAAADGLPASRQEADECLALHETRPAHAKPVAYEESWDDILLRRLHAVSRAGRTPARGPIAELRKHDTQHGTRYVPTLRAWLEAGGDIVQAADKMGVHPNTIRNRLRKMAEFTTIDLTDTEKRQAMIIALAIDD